MWQAHMHALHVWWSRTPQWSCRCMQYFPAMRRDRVCKMFFYVFYFWCVRCEDRIYDRRLAGWLTRDPLGYNLCAHYSNLIKSRHRSSFYIFIHMHMRAQNTTAVVIVVWVPFHVLLFCVTCIAQKFNWTHITTWELHLQSTWTVLLNGDTTETATIISVEWQLKCFVHTERKITQIGVCHPWGRRKSS